MKNKLLLSTFILFSLLFLIYSCTPTTNGTYKIGCITPLTGGGANYGKAAKLGIDYAIENYNKDAKVKIEVIFEDSQIDPKTGINAMNKLSFEKVPVIIGPFGSSVTNAIAPIANKNKIVLLGASATADNIKNAGDYVFRITPPNSKQGSTVADYTYASLEKRKAAIFFQNNDYGVSLKNAFKEKFAALGGEIVFEAGSDLEVLDFQTLIAKMKSSSPDVIFFPLHIKESTALLKQLLENGVNLPALSCDGAMVQEIIDNGQTAAEETYYSSLGLSKSNNKLKDFEKTYTSAHKENPNTYTSYYYEATMILLEAIKNSDYGDAVAIKEALYKINTDKPFSGITGITAFDNNGEVDKSFSIYQVNKGEFILIK